LSSFLENSKNSPYDSKSNYKLGLNKKRDQQIWAIAGGKGGVGKSLVTANVSICLALMGYKVSSVDLDLGGANLHTCLGVPIPEKTLSDYLSKKVRNFSDLLNDTPIENLSLISGAQDDLGIANLRHMQKTRLISKLRDIDSDYVLMDLGAGTSFNTLDFFINSDMGILTALPEPTSIENTYRFIKSFYHRKMKMIEDLLDIGPIIDKHLNSKLSYNFSPSELFEKMKEVNPEKAELLQAELSKFSPKLIINQVRTQADIDIGFSMKIICKKYFGIDLDYIGYLEYDSTVWQSVKKRKPLLMEFPNSALVTNFDRIVHNLFKI